jgi:hypothetical protein
LLFAFFGAFTVIRFESVTRFAPALVVCTLTLHFARFLLRTRRRPLREIFTFVTLLSPAFSENCRPAPAAATRYDIVKLFARGSTAMVTLPAQPFTAVMGHVT